MENEITPAKKSVWERTSVQCLLRNRESGNYYGRFKLHGKQKWVSLDTDVFTVAKQRLLDKQADMMRLRGAVVNVDSGKATVGNLMAVYRERTRNDPDLRDSSKKSRETALKKVIKTWAGIEGLEPKYITPPKVFEWAQRFKVEGTNFTPKGARTALKGNSARSINHAIDTLRRLMDIALERGQIATNPVTVKPPTGRLKKKIARKKLLLPPMEDIEKMLRAMENNGARGGWGIEAADLVRFLTLTGERIGEVPVTTWSCVDWKRDQMRIPGEKTDSSDRFIPLFPALAALLKKIKARRESAARFTDDKQPFTRPVDPIFRLKECQKSIDAACKKTGVERLTHHDFRHLFATICIESGVDIPTVAGWMGHNDGGVLAMQTYGHLRRDHSQAAAQKVQFGGLVAPPTPGVTPQN